MKAVFAALDDDDLSELLEKIVISLLFYGMLRQNEVLLLQTKDIVAKDDGEVVVKFPYATKTRDDGFEYFVPKKLRILYVK